MFTNHNNPYYVQCNTDPHSLHQAPNTTNTDPSHPYIIAQNNKKSNNYNNNNARYQTIGSQSSSNSPTNSNTINTKTNRKRKYIEIFEDDEQGQYEYEQSLTTTPQRKQHITEEVVMKSIRDDCAQNRHINTDLNSIDHTLNVLSLNNQKQRKSKRRKKRTFSEMNNNNNNDWECKDNMDELCNKMNKKMKIWDSKNDKSFPYLINHENKANDNDNNDNTDSNPTELELIPPIIQYAHFMNNDNAFVTKLCRRDSMQRMRLNKYTGALVKYVKPERKSWQELIQRYYQNNKHCNVEKLVEITDDNEDVINNDNDFEMNNGNGANKKNKRPIRLHTSYTGFNQNKFINSDQLKKIANKCYVSTVQRNKSNDKEENNDDWMDCD